MQLWWLSDLFGGFAASRYVHFFAMAGIVGFLAVHLLLVALVPKVLVADDPGRPSVGGPAMSRELDRRRLLGRALAFGAVGAADRRATTTTCSIPTSPTARCAAISRWNDKVQAALFNPDLLAPTYPASAITRPPRFNAFYEESPCTGRRRRHAGSWNSPA